MFDRVLKVVVPKSVRQTVSKLVECGFLVNKVRKYADSHSTESTVGLVGQVCDIVFWLPLFECDKFTSLYKVTSLNLILRDCL